MNKKDLTKYVAGSLLGDGSISKDKRDNGNCNFELTQIAEHKDYLDWFASILSNITSVSYYTIEGKETSILGRNTYAKEKVRIRSSRHPFFNTFRERLYYTGRKTVDEHYLKLLDWEMLAIWYMEDGFIYNYNAKHKYLQHRLGLCTNSYTYAEQLLLKRALKDILEVEFNAVAEKQNGNTQYRLYATQSSVPRIIDNIYKFILPSFEYKLCLELE